VSALRDLGRGWGFPVRVEPATGGLSAAAGPEKVRQSIRILLDTEPGERVMRPAFGAGLRRYLAEPNAAATHALIKLDVERALADFEPRIETTTVDVRAGADPALVEISIAYVHSRTRRPGNLVVVTRVG
jgi:phage baseplate assembly protein W